MKIMGIRSEYIINKWFEYCKNNPFLSTMSDEIPGLNKNEDNVVNVW